MGKEDQLDTVLSTVKAVALTIQEVAKAANISESDAITALKLLVMDGVPIILKDNRYRMAHTLEEFRMSAVNRNKLLVDGTADIEEWRD